MVHRFFLKLFLNKFQEKEEFTEPPNDVCDKTT